MARLSVVGALRGEPLGGVHLSWTLETVKEGLFIVDLQRYAKKGYGIGNLLP
jgi:hypothetical protein